LIRSENEDIVTILYSLYPSCLGHYRAHREEKPMWNLVLFYFRRLSVFSAGLWSVIFLVDYESS